MPVINKTTSLKSNVEIESVFNNGLSFSKGVIKILFLEKNSKSIDLFSQKLGLNFLRPDKILCNEKKCLFADETNLFFSDSNHLSKYGSIKTFKLFNKINFN